MSVKARARLCIIEDQAIVRAGLRMLLEGEPDIEVVGEAADRKGALEIANREHPDLFLVDVQLGVESAVDFLKELLAIDRADAILLTGISDKEAIYRAIEAGATGLVYKDADTEVLIRAIRKVRAGEGWMSRSLMTAAISRLARTHRTNNTRDPDASKIETLTAREREVIKIIASGANRRKAAETLYVSEATVRNHLTSIFAKLELSSQFDLVFYAQRHGLDSRPQIT
jgi:DNA-binding NarL/FixJ family response regulator